MIELVVGPAFALQTLAAPDGLCRRVWDAVGLPPEQTWLSISPTEDSRWI